MAKDGWTERPYTVWLEAVVREMVDIDPECIAMEMVDKNGMVHTCYWNCSADERAMMIGGMQSDDRMEWLRLNREEILEILNEDEGEEDDGGGDGWTTIS